MRSSSLRFTATAALLALAAPSLLAQDLNIDVGEDPASGSFGLPAATYGAAAAQPGTWNGLFDGAAGAATPGVGNPWYVGTNLLGLNGAATTVDCQAIASVGSNSVGDFIFNNGATTGNDQALMDDVGDCGGPPGALTWTFSQLANGTYDIYTYAWAPDSGTFITQVSVPGTTSPNPQSSGGNWPGTFVANVTHTKHTVVVTSGTLSITVSTLSGFGSVNGFQFDLQGVAASTPFCFGDGTGTPCPCGLVQNGAAGSGCKNSSGVGAKLSATGSNSVAANTMSLTCTGMLPGSFTIFTQGTATVNGGLGSLSPATDGLNCIGGTTVRLGRIGTMGGTASINNIPAQGAVPPAGGTRHYQANYRNQMIFCTTATMNTSNGITINWVP